MSDLNTEITITADSSGVEAGVGRAKRSLASLGASAKQAGAEAGEGIGSIGTGGDKAAGQVDRATKAIIGSVQRATAAIEAGERGTAKYYETLAGQRNVNVNALKPYLDQLKDAERAQQVASGSLDRMGISAKQTAAALRGVPAQFTDIITSLQGGQAPLTVFLQQGGQLKDVFGGAGAAAKALGGYVAGLINPFTAAAAAGVVLAVAYNQGSKEADAYRLAIVSTGNAAGTTAGQLKSYAQEISGVVGTQGKAAESLAAFVSTGRVSRDVLKEASQAAIAWERATGQAVGATAKQFADLGKDPLQAVLKLNEGTNFLTESVYRQIKSLDEQGRTAEAAAVAQRAYADALTGRSATITQNLGYIEAAWKGITDAAKKSWDAMLNVGRASTPADATAELRTRLMRQQEELAAKKAINPYADTRGMEKGIEILKQRLGLLESDERQTRRLAEAEAERAKQMQATAAWDKEGAKYLTDKAKLERDLTAARNEGLAAGKSQAEIEQRLAQIRDSYAKKGGSSVAAENKELRDQQRIFAELAGVSSTYYAELANAQKQRAAGVITEQQYVQAVEQLIQKQPFAVAQAKDLAEAEKERAKASAELTKTMDEYARAQAAGVSSAVVAAQQAEDQLAQYGLLKSEVQSLTLAYLEQSRESAALAGEDVENIDKRIAAQKRLIAATRGLEARQTADDAAKRAEDDWKRAAESIERSLTDSLMRGFESGKGFAENLIASLKNMFSTLVLRPIISAAMSPVAGAINGMLYGNAAAAVGGGANALGMLGSGANLITGLQGTQGMLGTVGGWLGLNTVAANTGLAATIGIDAASAAAAANAAGAAGGGLLSGVGAALPWIGGIAALVSILGGLDDSGTYHTGGAAQYSGARGLMSGQDATGYNIGFGRVEAGAQTITAVSTLAQSLGTALDGIAVAFGQTAGYEIATAFADDTSEDGAWGGLRISRDGQELLNWENNRQSRWAPREFGDGEEGYRQYLAAVAQDTRQVLLDMDLPSWADKMLESIGDSASMEQLTGVLNQIGVVQSAFVALGNSMAMFADLTDEMQSGLLDAAGSIEALTAGAGAFYQGFYSEQERIDAAVAQLNEALGGLDLSIDPRLGDDAKGQFRAAVEAAFAAGDAELAAALLALSGTFANTADYFQQIAAQQADTMGRLQIDLLRAQGDNLAAVALERERELAALAQFGPAAVAMQQQIYGLIDAMAASNAAANAYFADIDRAAAEQGYTDDAQAALDALFGSISGGADAAAQSAASAAADAAKAAAASWRTAASSIQSSLEKLRAGTTALSDPASRYAETKSVLDEYTRLALGGDASAAEKLAGAADAFLSASADGTMTQAEYLRDRVLTEAKLASVMESSEAQASLQESIASSAGAAVSELQALNSNLTGFAGDLYDLLRNSYSDVGRDGATGIAATFAKMQADFDAYFNATTGWAAVGSKYSDPSFGGASFTKLDNNMAQFTGADGSIGYIRAGESLLDVAKRIPELRKLWEQTYNIRLPAFAVGTNYVPKDMTARIHEGEAIVPKAFNPWANGGGGADNAEVVAELRGLSSQLSRLEARLAEIEKTNDQMAQQQDNGTDGGNAYRAEIMNVAALAQAIKEATV